jgi:arylsulfatase A-like enzyme
LTVIWFGSPHDPHHALEADKKPYAGRSAAEQNYFGELAAMDRAMGSLRAELRRLSIAPNTLLWFCSDNGGAFGMDSTRGLRGKKGSLWEGGVRVPGIVEWPARLKRPAVTAVPCVTSDILPTVASILGLELKDWPRPLDGISLLPLFDGTMSSRPAPIAFWKHGRDGGGHRALTDNRFKLHLGAEGEKTKALLYDLLADPKETTDLSGKEPETVAGMEKALEGWKTSVERSLKGEDYLGGKRG